jgi:hypothetical protein
MSLLFLENSRCPNGFPEDQTDVLSDANMAAVEEMYGGVRDEECEIEDRGL